MKKIFLWGYWTQNFGDDLFLKVYQKQMKKFNIKTYILTEKRYSDFYKNMGFNTICKNTFFYRLTYKFLAIFNLPELFFLLINKNDLFVMLGGSLFAENKGMIAEKMQFRNLEYATNKAKKSFVIGSNFGPYKTEEFKTNYAKLFKNMEDVSFRDQKSYELFSQELKNVRYAPDIAFEGRWTESREKKDCIVVSVIDLENRQNLFKYKDIYEKGIVTICLHHIKKGKKVYLLSLCDKEGDTITCDNIRKMIDEKYKKYVKVVNYESIDETINLLSSANKIYATRFHALMMALYFKKNVIPIIYNEKGINAIKSYCRDLQWFEIADFNGITIDRMINTNQIADLQIPNSKQFQKLDEYCKLRYNHNGN